jgi:acyl-CoA thioester hydrolase
MARITIDLPTEFRFSTAISIRITDINYGGHVGNDTILSLVHEARMQFLNSAGYTEMNCGGTGLIMTDAAIEFKKELFYGEVVKVSVVATNFSKISFELFYKMEKQMEGKTVLVAKVKTSMVCFDYSAKKVTTFSPEVIEKLTTA